MDWVLARISILFPFVISIVFISCYAAWILKKKTANYIKIFKIPVSEYGDEMLKNVVNHMFMILIITTIAPQPRMWTAGQRRRNFSIDFFTNIAVKVSFCGLHCFSKNSMCNFCFDKYSLSRNCKVNAIDFYDTTASNIDRLLISNKWGNLSRFGCHCAPYASSRACCNM